MLSECACQWNVAEFDRKGRVWVADCVCCGYCRVRLVCLWRGGRRGTGCCYDTGCWRRGEERQKGSGKEKVGARGKKPRFVVPGIVSSDGVVVFAVGVASDEI